MHRFFLKASLATVLLMMPSTAAIAGKSAADFPLRVHIFGHSGHSHYYYHTLNNVDGEGRANLYENGEPRGFDFGFNCGERLRNSAGFETYVARWKKPGRELEILLPQFGGKPGAVDSCNLEVAMKDAAYHRHNGELELEPAPVFKAWMVKHQYDPEHGMNTPMNQGAAAAPGEEPSQQ